MASVKPAGYKLATYKSAEGPRAGLIVGEDVFDVAKLTGKPAYATVLGILADWKAAEGALRKAAATAAKSRGKRLPLKKAKLLAPIQGSVAIYCAGANYGDHAAAMAAREANPPPPDPHSQGLKPFHFLKAPGTIVASGTPIKISHYAKAMDWEIELAAVIGRPAKDVPKEKALGYVAGYMVSNDLSARDRGRRDAVAPTSPFKMDWLKHKTFEGSCPIGPWIVPASELKQDSNTSKMLFTLAEQIEQLSVNMTLHPGDLVLTGTPSGTGAESGTFLKAGDVVKVWIEKIGEIENRMA
jgi:2-keto-4-pentenoate hydratase/2-oxohepta-3-ene-1,7-dioic acid hydratase in catechol pathway